MKSLKSQSVIIIGFALLKPWVGCAVCYSPCYNIRIKLLVLEHTGCNVCYNTRIKLLEHTSVVV